MSFFEPFLRVHAPIGRALALLLLRAPTQVA